MQLIVEQLINYAHFTHYGNKYFDIISIGFSQGLKVTMDTSLKVLVVDDDPFNLDIIEEMLEGQYETCLVESGEDALKKINDFAADVVLLDVMMPGINGFETCEKLRANSALSDLKIIMLSAKTGQESIDRGLAAGANEYAAKPFNEEGLIELIKRHV